MARIALLISLMLLAAGSRAWTQDTPVRAFVGDDGGTAHSGPDAVHYGTSQLSPGSPVEIYRLDPGRWCAIRPPADSFSLVRADALEWIDPEAGVAEIIVDGERCWTGTALGAVDEPMWQVKLRRGERVQVLGTIPSPDDSESIEWFQIAPPSGEFRWIRLADLNQDSQAHVVAHFAAGESNANDSPRRMKTILVRDQIDRDVIAATSRSEDAKQDGNANNDVSLALFDQADDHSSMDEPLEEPMESDEQGEWRKPRYRRAFGQFTISSDTSIGDQVGFVTPSPSQRTEVAGVPSVVGDPSLGGPTQWAPQLQDLDLRLSAEILKDPAQWDLQPIVADLTRFRSNASHHSDLLTADHILNKVHRFQAIQQNRLGASGSMAVASSPPATGVQAIVGQQAIPIERVAGEVAGPNGAAYGQTYDAYGWLNELVRDGGMGQSTYVLQDDTGRITHVISGTPGLNLHRYLKTKVGIIGQKGYHQRMNLDHVTAERIVDLDTIRR